MKYFFITGEASGDKHGAAIYTEILRYDPGAQLRYSGGPEMAKATGIEPVVNINDMAFMGFVEVVLNLNAIQKNFKRIKNAIEDFKPDVVVLVDYPGFNLRMAKWCSKKNYKVIYYISPSVWAWHKSRIETIRKYTDLMICILPFEEAFYAKHKVNAIYLGNPIADKVNSFNADHGFLEKYQFNKPILALLPGSRKQEITKLLPVMLDAAESFTQSHDIVIAQADNLDPALYRNILSQRKNYHLLPNEYYNLLSHAQLAIVTSGTATLETALFKVPQVVVYKTNALTYAVAKMLVDIQFIALPNLIANAPVVKELIQSDCTSENIVMELNLLQQLTKEHYDNFYQPMLQKIGSGHSAERIAQKIVEVTRH